ncbi:MAG: glycine cleavage system protein GcvH [Bdellovibrionota bacterium]
MRFPENLKYTKDHEWAKIDGNTATIGITDHAQKALGDIVYCELPAVGRTLKAHETFGVVESIKAVSDLYSPLAGKVTASNEAVTQDPAKLNADPYAGWMIRLEIADTSALKDLMDAGAYTKYVDSLK